MKNEKLVIVSLFDGISCGQIAINKKTKNYVYYASEIEKAPIKITKHNYPNTYHIGDVRELRRDHFPHNEIFLLTGGSPCQDLSLAGRRNGLATKENIEVNSIEQYLKLKKENVQFEGSSFLFWEYVRMLHVLQPKYFLLENVKMAKKWEDIITNALGVLPIKINSSKVSAQNRERIYWTNIPNVNIPEDKNINLSDIIDGAKACGNRNVPSKIPGKKWDNNFTIRKDGKSNCIVTSNSNTQKIILPDGTIRQLTINEAELLQTLPLNYTKAPNISLSARYKAIGNGWTVDVIDHFYNHIPELAS